MNHRVTGLLPLNISQLSGYARHHRTGALMFLLWTAAAGNCLAVDGVIEINQARALAGGVTPTDAPGYPVTIDQPGSYLLTGNLEPSGSPTAVIGVLVDDVSIDLNGFVINGAALDAGSNTAGILSQTRNNISVKNGAVVNTTGTWAIQLGSYSGVDDVRVGNNGGDGINCNLNCILTKCHVYGNGADGISVNHNAIVTDNVVWTNMGNGITAEIPARINNNVVVTNEGSGIVTRGGTITNNVVRGSGVHGIDSNKEQPGSDSSNATIVGNSVVDSLGGDGIRAGDGSTVLSNTVAHSSNAGIRMGSKTGYGNNVITNSGNDDVVGGIEIGSNVCGVNTDCP